jgi:hypothetical protein
MAGQDSRRLSSPRSNEQLLARRSIVARANVAHAAVADIKAFDDREANRFRTLDDPTAHASEETSEGLLLGLHVLSIAQ